MSRWTRNSRAAKLFGVCLLLTWAPSGVWAAGVSYDVADGCPGQSQFEAQVGDDCDLQSLDMRIVVRRDPVGFRLKLLVQSATSSYPEEKTAARCSQLVELAAHVARLVCQPEADQDTAAEKSRQSPEAPSTTASNSAGGGTVPSPAPRAFAPNDNTSTESGALPLVFWRHPWVAVGALAQTGSSPGLDAALSLDLGVELSRHSLALGVTVWRPRELWVELEPDHQTTLNLNRVSLQLQDCLRHNTPSGAAVGRWGFGACVSFGYQIVSSHFPAGTQPVDYRSWPTVSAGLSALHKMTEHLAVEGQAGVNVHIAAAPVSAAPFGVVHEFGTLASFVGTRLIWAFDQPGDAIAAKSDQTNEETRELSAQRSLMDGNAW